MKNERWEQVKGVTWFKDIQKEVTEYVELLRAQVARQLQWISDMQSGCYINCVYCGHRYGPLETAPVSRAEMLKQHIEVCPEHPMSALKKKHEELLKWTKELVAMNKAMLDSKNMLSPGPHIAFFAAATAALEDTLKDME